jgi:hypothetical protein
MRADDHAAHYAHRIECRLSRERKMKRFSMIYVHRRLKAVDIDAIYPDKLAIDDGMAPTASNNNLTTSVNGLALTADDFMRTFDYVIRQWGVTLSLPAYVYVHEQHYDVLLSPIIKVDCASEESENTAFNGIFALSSFIRNNIFYVTMVLVTIFCDATKEAQGWGACEGLVDWQGSAYDIIDIDILARSPKRSERRGVTRNKSECSHGGTGTADLWTDLNSGFHWGLIHSSDCERFECHCLMSTHIIRSLFTRNSWSILDTQDNSLVSGLGWNVWCCLSGLTSGIKWYMVRLRSPMIESLLVIGQS